MIRRILMAVLPVVVLAAGGYAAWTMVSSRPQQQTRAAEAIVPAVRVLEAQRGAFAITVVAEGTVQPSAETQLTPEVAGRIMEIAPALAVGGFFNEGDVLLRLDSREYDLAAVRAKAAVAQAELRLAVEREEARVAAEEWKRLGEGAPNPLILREPQLAEAQALLDAALAAVTQADYDIERTAIRAPFAGRVRERGVHLGQFVQRGVPLAAVYAVDGVEIRLPLPDSDLAYIDLPLGEADGAAGARVAVRAEFAGRTYEWQGRIVRTDAVIDPRTRMIHAIVRVDNPFDRGTDGNRPPLTPGMFVRVEIPGRSSGPVVALPRTAVRPDGTVLVVDSEGRLAFRNIDIYRAEQDRLLIRSGIEPGDRVVTSNLEGAANGMQVRIEEPQGAE